MKYKLSKQAWESIGKQAGWMEDNVKSDWEFDIKKTIEAFEKGVAFSDIDTQFGKHMAKMYDNSEDVNVKEWAKDYLENAIEHYDFQHTQGTLEEAKSTARADGADPWVEKATWGKV